MGCVGKSVSLGKAQRKSDGILAAVIRRFSADYAALDPVPTIHFLMRDDLEHRPRFPFFFPITVADRFGPSRPPSSVGSVQRLLLLPAFLRPRQRALRGAGSFLVYHLGIRIGRWVAAEYPGPGSGMGSDHGVGLAWVV